MTYRGAVAAAIAQEMERDPTVVFVGEDIGAAGGVFKTTEGLLDKFGPKRVRDTPISEQAIVGAVMALIWQASTMRWSMGASWGRLMTSKPAPMCSDRTMCSSLSAFIIGSQ